MDANNNDLMDILTKRNNVKLRENNERIKSSYAMLKSFIDSLEPSEFDDITEEKKAAQEIEVDSNKTKEGLPIIGSSYVDTRMEVGQINTDLNNVNDDNKELDEELELMNLQNQQNYNDDTLQRELEPYEQEIEAEIERLLQQKRQLEELEEDLYIQTLREQNKNSPLQKQQQQQQGQEQQEEQPEQQQDEGQQELTVEPPEVMNL